MPPLVQINDIPDHQNILKNSFQNWQIIIFGIIRSKSLCEWMQWDKSYFYPKKNTGKRRGILSWLVCQMFICIDAQIVIWVLNVLHCRRILQVTCRFMWSEHLKNLKYRFFLKRQEGLNIRISILYTEFNKMRMQHDLLSTLFNPLHNMKQWILSL